MSMHDIELARICLHMTRPLADVVAAHAPIATTVPTSPGPGGGRPTPNVNVRACTPSVPLNLGFRAGFRRVCLRGGSQGFGLPFIARRSLWLLYYSDDRVTGCRAVPLALYYLLTRLFGSLLPAWTVDSLK